MTRLTETQAIVLSAAVQREDRNVLPLPANLRGGAITKVVTAMLRKGLIDEVEADRRKSGPVWRETGDGHGTTLIATAAGLAAIGIEPDGGASAPTSADKAPSAEPPKRRGGPRRTSSVGADVALARKPRDGTKQDRVIAMLRRKEGATIAQVADATGWASHSVRGFFAGALKKRLGLEVASEKVEGTRVYRIAEM